MAVSCGYFLQLLTYFPPSASPSRSRQPPRPSAPYSPLLNDEAEAHGVEVGVLLLELIRCGLGVVGDLEDDATV